MTDNPVYEQIRKYRVVQNVTAGNNVIIHDLNMPALAVIVETRDNTTGNQLASRVVGESATTTTIYFAVSQTNVRITIIG